MTSARDRAAQLRARNRKDESEPAAPRPTPPPSPKPVRQTVDLTHARHVALAQWRMEAAVQLGRTRLTTQDVLAGLVGVLLTDETVSRRVKAFLETSDQT